MKRAAHKAALDFSRCVRNSYAAAAATTEAMRLKMVEMLVEMPGSRAPAATAMKPASNAYSTMSWPLRSLTKRAIKYWILRIGVFSLCQKNMLESCEFCGKPQQPHEPIMLDESRTGYGWLVPFFVGDIPVCPDRDGVVGPAGTVSVSC